MRSVSNYHSDRENEETGLKGTVIYPHAASRQPAGGNAQRPLRKTVTLAQSSPSLPGPANVRAPSRSLFASFQKWKI